MASVFTGRVFCVQAVAVHAQVSDVLNVTEDLDAAPVQIAVAQAQSVAVAAPTVVARAQNVGAVVLTVAGDPDALAVHNAVAYLHVARELSGKVVAHNCAQVDPDVARVSRSGPGVQVARHDLFPPVAGSFPGVPAVHFSQADLFSRVAPDVPKGFRFPLPAVWLVWLAVVALAANR